MAERTVYATKDDVQRFIKRVQFSDTTKVTPSDVDFFIQVVSNVVDGELRKLGIDLPVPSSCKVTMDVLRLLVSYEAASMAEQVANFGANKNESTHGQYLHQRYLDLLVVIETNPCVLSDVVTGTVKHMKSDTEDMLEGEAKEGDEIFTKKHIDDFRDDFKILSESEKSSESDSVTGEVPRSRV